MCSVNRNQQKHNCRKTRYMCNFNSCKVLTSAQGISAPADEPSHGTLVWSGLIPGLRTYLQLHPRGANLTLIECRNDQKQIHKMPPRINLPPLTRALLLTLLSLSAINAVLRFRSWSSATPANEQSATKPSTYLTSSQWAIPYLVLIPSKSIVYPWTFLTSALIENNIVSLVISSAVVWFGGKYLERAWGGQEFAKFVLFVTMIPSILTFFIYAVWHGLAGYFPPQ
jgi:membrane associated rhomboid family serine protease